MGFHVWPQPNSKGSLSPQLLSMPWCTGELGVLKRFPHSTVGETVLLFRLAALRLFPVSGWDHCHNLPMASLLSPLLPQSVLTTAARVMLFRPRSDHVTALLRTFQRLHTSLSKLKAQVLMVTCKTRFYPHHLLLFPCIHSVQPQWPPCSSLDTFLSQGHFCLLLFLCLST